MTERPRDKWDYIYYALIAGTVFFFGMALVGFVGELLGWWNDVGEWLMRSGSVGGLALAAITLVVGASRSQVDRALAGIDETKGAVDETRDAVHETKDAVHETKDAVHETKDAVHETKEAVDETRIAVEANGAKLDAVTNHLEEQTEVLRDIRDAS